MNTIGMFQQWLIADGKADTTIASYMNDVKKFNEYLIVREVDEVYINRFYFTSYIKYLKVQGAAVNTINKKIISLKVYNDWLLKEGLVDDLFVHIKRDKVSVAIGSETEVNVLTEEEIERFLFYLEKEKQRNRVIGYVLLYTGLRVSELVNLKLRDIDYLTNVLRIRGKGGKLREVPIRPDVLEVIQQYISGERCRTKFIASDYLLVSQRAIKLHRDTIRKWLEIVGEKLKISIHPHMIRHTFCTRLLKNGVDISIVAKLAGHSSVNTTIKYYINVSKKEKQNAVELL